MGIFEGTTSEKGFTYNLEFLRDGRYMLAGRFVWWSLSQGGPGIPALNSAVYAFMLGQPMVLNEALSAIGEPMRKNLDMVKFQLLIIRPDKRGNGDRFTAPAYPWVNNWLIVT